MSYPPALKRSEAASWPPLRVLAYVRGSTAEQVESGAGLEAQRAAILAEAIRRGWTEVEFVTDAGLSAASMKRPGLRDALDRLAAGEAGVLIVSKMDRLSRSLLDFAGIMQQAQREGWALIALDSPADMTTPHGEAMAGVRAVFAQLERRLISQRTREALAAKRAAGVRLGRPLELSDDVAQAIIAARANGGSLRAIADDLNARAVPTAHGGARWHASTVKAVLDRS